MIFFLSNADEHDRQILQLVDCLRSPVFTEELFLRGVLNAKIHPSMMKMLLQSECFNSEV